MVDEHFDQFFESNYQSIPLHYPSLKHMIIQIESLFPPKMIEKFKEVLNFFLLNINVVGKITIRGTY